MDKGNNKYIEIKEINTERWAVWEQNALIRNSVFRNRSQLSGDNENGGNWQQWKAENISFPNLVLFLL